MNSLQFFVCKEWWICSQCKLKVIAEFDIPHTLTITQNLDFPGQHIILFLDCCTFYFHYQKQHMTFSSTSFFPELGCTPSQTWPPVWPWAERQGCQVSRRLGRGRGISQACLCLWLSPHTNQAAVPFKCRAHRIQSYCTLDLGGRIGSIGGRASKSEILTCLTLSGNGS